MRTQQSHQLPELDMVVNPTPVNCWCFKFEVTVNGTVMTLTRIDRDKKKDPGWWSTGMHFRVYSRNKFHYSFELTEYLYHGIEHELVPEDAMEKHLWDQLKLY